MESARDTWTRAEINEVRKKLKELEKQLVDLGKEQEKKKRKRDEEKKAAESAAAAAEDDDGSVRAMCCPYCSLVFKVTVSKE